MIYFIVTIFENYKIHSYIEAWDYQISKRQITKKLVVNGHSGSNTMLGPVGEYANNYEPSLSVSRVQKHTQKNGIKQRCISTQCKIMVIKIQ